MNNEYHSREMPTSLDEFAQAEKRQSWYCILWGDSLTYYGIYYSVFPDEVVGNLGLRGDTISRMTDRLEQVRALEPKEVYLMAGINDVSNLSAEVFARSYMELLVSLKTSLPNTELILQLLYHQFSIIQY